MFGRGGASSEDAISDPNILDAADCLCEPFDVNTTERGEREDELGSGLGGTKGKLASTESVFDANDCTDSGR